MPEGLHPRVERRGMRDEIEKWIERDDRSLLGAVSPLV